MNAYESKRQERIDRLNGAAERAGKAAEAASQRAHALLDPIPFGQPVLVGHHSEAMHRSTLRKADNAMRKASDELEKQREMEHRAAAAEANTAISSDDPEAVTKLESKLGAMIDRRDRCKLINKVHTAFLKKGEAAFAGTGLCEAEQEFIRNYTPKYSWEPHPIPPYEFQNQGGNIRRVQERIEQLKKARDAREAMAAEQGIGSPKVEVEVGAVTIVENLEINRLQILFPGKPGDAVRAKLKAYGFRWAPSEGAWQRQLSNQARYAADLVAQAYNAG